MVYVERLKRKDKTYYYVSKNFRVGPRKWRKIREYAGEKPPSKEKIKKLVVEIEKQAKREGLVKKIKKHMLLTDEEAEQLQDLRDVFIKWYKKIDEISKNKYEDDFLVRFTYNSNAIEGNRLSLRETSMALTEDIIPAGVSPNDYNETMNSKDCFEFIKTYRGELNQKFLLKVHRLLTKNTKCRIAGKYRDDNVHISGSEWIPPSVEKLKKEMKTFFQWYYHARRKLHPVELAAMSHNKLVRIHPFTDGNGRTARTIMNWLLSKNRFPMLYIEMKDKINYYKAIEDGDRGNDAVFGHYITKALIKQHTFNP